MTRVPDAHTGRSVRRFGFLQDPESRKLRARRIIVVLDELGHVDLRRARLLDIGCSTGLITMEIARHVSFVVGVDVDAESVQLAAGASEGAMSPHFLLASGASLPFADASFHAVVCNHVYEHVPDPQFLMQEIRRVLLPEGVCYFAAGHTLQLVEPHYRLPLLSWVPRGFADACLRAIGQGGRYEERFLPPWRLHTLFGGFAAAELVSPAMLRDPKRYGFPGIARLPVALRFVISTLARPLALLAPTWIWLLRR